MAVSRISSRGFVLSQIFDMQVSLSRCARAALTVQAHGTPLAQKVDLTGTPTYGVQVSLVVARERRLRCRRMERHSRIKVDMTGTPTYGVQVSLVVARERRLLCRRMERHSRKKWT